MKRYLLALCSLALALGFTSCFEHTSTLKLEKDGSGTITEETLLGTEASAMLRSMPAPEGKDPLSQMADKAKAEKTAKEMGEGVTVEKVEKIDKDGRKGGRVVYKFKDINTLKYTFGKSMADAGEGMGGEAKKKEQEPMTFSYKDGTLVMKPGKPDKEEKPKPVDEISDQEITMTQGIFKDMRMTMKVEVAGGIAETNATHVEGNTITLMDMQFAKLVADPARFRKFVQMRPETPAEMEKALEGVEGVKLETKEEITVKVK